MSDRLPSRGVFTFVAAVLLASALVAVPAVRADAATYAGHPVPGVWDVTPLVGEVVPSSHVTVTGKAMSFDGVASVQIRIDGAGLATTTTQQDDVVTRAEAAADVDAGQHLAELIFTDGNGQVHQRSWPFTVVPIETHRLAGKDRIETAVRIASQSRDPQTATDAILARADQFADALAGAPLASVLDAPLLLTGSQDLSADTGQALTDLVQPGGTVHLLGGESALSADVASRVRDLGFKVDRLAGADRFETAAAIAAQMPASDGAVVVSGFSFPDALVVAVPASHRGWPVLLTAPGALPVATRDALSGRATATIVGGTSVISDEVQSAVEQEVDAVARIAGADRYETSTEIARSLGPEAGAPVALASGEDFADALAGSVHAARIGASLVLSRSGALPSPTASYVHDESPSSLWIYGGVSALHSSVLSEATASLADAGPALESIDPGPGTEIHNIDQFTMKFASSVDPSATRVSVWFSSVELPITWSSGDFDNTVVVTVKALPGEPRYDDPIALRLTAVVQDSNGHLRHLDRTYTYRKIAMTRGDDGPNVQALQDRLRDLHYWIGTPDGTYGTLTVQAVMAFQKYEGLPVTGTADAATLARLESASRPVPQYSGTHAEVDKTRQVLLFVNNGVVDWVFNTSTGTEKAYSEDGHSGVADTPPGTFRVCREYDGLREADLGTLWRPKYFNCSQGIAIHGASNVPGYPASHGCVRVTYAAIDYIWANDYLPMGRTVIVYGRYPGT